MHFKNKQDKKLYLELKKENNSLRNVLTTTRELKERIFSENRDLNIQINQLRIDLNRAKNQYNSVLEQQNIINKKLRENLEAEKEVWKKQTEKEIRADALKRAKTINHGFSSENFAPLLAPQDPNTPACINNHKDFRHIGDPIDYLIVCGADSIRKKESDDITHVFLLDIKTGKASLNKVQRRIRDAIKEGRVSFAIYNTDTKSFRSWGPVIKD